MWEIPGKVEEYDEWSPCRGAYSAPADLMAVFKGPTSRGRERGENEVWSLQDIK